MNRLLDYQFALCSLWEASQTVNSLHILMSELFLRKEPNLSEQDEKDKAFIVGLIYAVVKRRGKFRAMVNELEVLHPTLIEIKPAIYSKWRSDRIAMKPNLKNEAR